MRETEVDDDRVNGADSRVSRAPASLIGRTIDGRYRVEALLGEGGMGLVYRVTHAHLNKPLAIKVLRRENTGDEEVLARFRREAESASAIGHQHIVDIHDFGMLTDGSTYFVMEYLEGRDLIDTIDEARRMPEERALHIAIQICKALGAAHDAGIVHRDLKPENVFLTRLQDTDDFVKILDFGIAKVADGPKRLTRDGEVLGTPHYMSPEQCEGENVDHRTDIYALGVLLYEMLTGHVPHDADTMMGILTKHMYEDPIPPKIRVPHVSEELEQIVMRCLEKKPERRYQTMAELERDLARIGVGRAPMGPETATLTPTRPPGRRLSPLYLGGLAAALLALAGTLAWRASNEAEASRAPTTLAGPPHHERAPAPSMLTRDSDSTEASAVTSASESPGPELKPARRKAARHQPESRPESVSRGEYVILDPWE